MTEVQADNASLQSIVEGLRAKQASLVERQGTLTTELTTVDDELKRTTAALTALVQTVKPKRGKKRPRATKDEVTGAIVEVLNGNGPVARVELSRSVKARLAEAGKSNGGVSALLKDALTDECFENTAEGYRLRAGSYGQQAVSQEVGGFNQR